MNNGHLNKTTSLFFTSLVAVIKITHNIQYAQYRVMDGQKERVSRCFLNRRIQKLNLLVFIEKQIVNHVPSVGRTDKVSYRVKKVVFFGLKCVTFQKQ